MNNVYKQIEHLSNRILKLEKYLKLNPHDKDALRALYVIIGRKRRLSIYQTQQDIKHKKKV